MSSISREELIRRLEEAEETLRAIREGEIDALVVRGLRQEEVFTLEGGTESYRAFMESMDLGAAALDAAHNVLYANAALSGLLAKSREALYRDGLYSCFTPEAARAMQRAVRAAGEGCGTASAEVQVARGSDWLHLLATAAPMQIGPSHGIAITFTDMTERVRAAAAEESNRVAHAVIASANEAVVVCDRDGIVTHANAAVRAIVLDDPVGKAFGAAFPLMFDETPSLLSRDDFVRLPIAGTPVQGIEATAPQAPRSKDLLVSAAPLVAGESILGCVITLVDLTQRKAAERQQQLLMRELDHRVKNTLTLVMAICTRTASSEDTVEGFLKAFAERIHSLAATHSLLAAKSWTDLLVSDLVRTELAPFAPDGDRRIELNGLEEAVTPRAAIALGLIFHELTTNAVKYGSLSREGGHLSVSTLPCDPRGPLLLEWRERDGPPVTPPTHRGFGHIVIARSLSYAPGGGTDICFDPEGLQVVIRIPREDVAS